LKEKLSSRDKVREGLSAALDRKASAVLVFNLTELTTMADYFVLSTANNDRQARAIDHQSTMGAYVGQLAKKDGRGVMVNWHYADGARYQPADAEIRKLRKD